jgi:transposase
LDSVDAAALHARIEALTAERDHVAVELDEYRKLYQQTLEQCRKLELGIVGPKRERLSPNDQQLAMSLLATLLGKQSPEAGAPAFEAEVERVREHERRKPTGRKPLPENLPRIEIEVLPREVEREGRDAFERIGQEVTETVERRPASLVVVRTIRPKFVRRDRERLAETEVLIGEPLELPIERGLAGPALLADTIVRRWQDHLPLYRLEQVYAREGLELARSTVCAWHMELAHLVAPLLVAMWKDALASPYLCTDATGVLVQAKEKCKKGCFFVVVAPERHVLYGYSPRHNGAAVDRLLAGYQGYLVADAHTVYDHLYKGGVVVEVGCWAHTRRYFFKSLESDPDRARQALALIGALFRVERQIADAPTGKRHAVRQRESRPLVDRFFDWCKAEAQHVLDETPIARGIGYAINQRVALERFLDDASLPIHNNASENALRRECVGRKNWLFVGSDDGGETNAAFVSLLASCQLHGIEPAAYLRDLFCLLPSWPMSRVLELSPKNWNQTLEHHDAQQRLAANFFRRVSLGQLDHPLNT